MKISVALCGLLITTFGFVESGFLHGTNHGLIGTPISTSSLVTTRTFHAGPITGSLGNSGRGNSIGAASGYGAGYSAGYGSGHGGGHATGTSAGYTTNSNGAALGTHHGYSSGGISPTVSAVSTYGYNAVTSNAGGAGGGNAAYGYNSGYGHGRY